MRSLFFAAAVICFFGLIQGSASAKEYGTTWSVQKPFRLIPNGHPSPTVSLNTRINKVPYIVLDNRGTILSPVFANGVEVDLVWKNWTNNYEVYPDHLCIALYTEGTQRHWPGEVEEGVVVRITHHQVAIQRFKWKAAGHIPIGEKPIVTKPGIEYKISVKGTRDGQVEVRVTGDDQDVTVKGQAKDPEKFIKDTRVAIYNREGVNFSRHRTWIRNLEIRDLIPLVLDAGLLPTGGKK
jgi:hypothetical protein